MTDQAMRLVFRWGDEVLTHDAKAGDIIEVSDALTVPTKTMGLRIDYDADRLTITVRTQRHAHHALRLNESRVQKVAKERRKKGLPIGDTGCSVSLRGPID